MVLVSRPSKRLSIAACFVSVALITSCRGPQDAFVPAPQSEQAKVSLTATPATINAGDSVTLTVSSTNVSAVTIDNGVGTAPMNGNVTVKPTQTTTYTATGTT